MDHESSNRLKTELLIQMDGLAKTSHHIFILAATNLPWELDQAILRRLEKRIFIDLPDNESRQQIFQKRINKNLRDGYGRPIVDESLDYGRFAELTGGNSY